MKEVEKKDLEQIFHICLVSNQINEKLKNQQKKDDHV